jgi:tRNA A37 threonylcarbamoyladenosine dehydratase
VKRKFSIDAIFSTEQLRYPNSEGNVCHAKQSGDGSMRLDCSGGFGAATQVTACFAFFAVAKAMDKYLKKALS